ncbi:MAG: hypothetical protein DRO89_00005 [Candidatus Altiarchaeales archaeon]|nr:MAG: hypothetical protein DRO89_00005 [Candidatus Altiarchaeales archaeon]
MTGKGRRSSIDNIEINKDENYLIVSVNPKIYNLDIVYYAAYVLMDRAYAILGGDPEREILVELRPKDNTDLETLGREFNNELLNYAVYMKQSAKNQRLREAILQRVLMTNLAPVEGEEAKDPEGIARPWREKHGKGRKKS